MKQAPIRLLRRPALPAWGGAVLALMLPAGNPGLAVPGQDMGNKVEIREEGWPVPRQEGAVRQGKRFLDLSPLIEGEETKAIAFQSSQFPLFVVWSIDGERYAIICDEDGRGPFEYGIWDMDGDGKFETKTGAYRKIRPPRWVVDKYYLRRGLSPPPPEEDPSKAGNAGEESPPESAPKPATGSD